MTQREQTSANESGQEIETPLLASQDQRRGDRARRRRLGSKPATTLAAMTSGEVSTLHMALFIATVWILSSLRVHRLKAFWRVGLRLMRTRGPSGYLLPRGPKARAAAGGSVSGAGASGVS
ncbi:hypothetical protein [Mesorhizobium sp. B2-9-1]|uniref:hypothetical protein n=1 Tax=Mesorhizobium sp. B2-9-1 TaxID=2589898 RepID=UPI001FEEC57C|nr:hypothetical protein [Mesorhizobium sp. B2-9-1]